MRKAFVAFHVLRDCGRNYDRSELYAYSVTTHSQLFPKCRDFQTLGKNYFTESRLAALRTKLHAVERSGCNASVFICIKSTIIRPHRLDNISYRKSLRKRNRSEKL